MDIPKRNRAIRDLRGNTYGRLRVMDFAGTRHGTAYWSCVCECGAARVVSGAHLVSGHTTSCGCANREGTAQRNFKHGATSRGNWKREYGVWASMVQRCHNPNSTSYRLYGARGIRVCDRWRTSFTNFLEDMGGEIPKGMSLDRIDPNGDYTSENCRLATATTQARNKRSTQYITHEGLTLTIPEWAERNGVKAATIRARLQMGWSPSEAVQMAAQLGANQTLRS